MPKKRRPKKPRQWMRGDVIITKSGRRYIVMESGAWKRYD